MIIACMCFVLFAFPYPGAADENKHTVLCTTFPICQITRNVTQGRSGVKIDLMLPSQLGCPHDYALTPQDMQKLAKADILVVNGLGMEEFLGAPVEKANPNITVIDSSIGIKETLEYSEEHNRDHGQHHAAGEHHAEGHDHDHHNDSKDREHGHHRDGKDHEHGHHHQHAGTNPHLFTSPHMTAKLALNIAAELSKADPAGAAVYFKNAKTYAKTMNKLAEEMAVLGKRLKNNRIVQPHGIFDYLARDMGLELVAVMQAHGQEPSAAEMMQLVGVIKEKQAGAIFTEPQYPEKVGKTLSQETGVPIDTLDPVATGPDNAPLNYYETIMRKNMKILEATLGVQ